MRRAPGCNELIYMFDGDKNGVCWHLGTAGGTQPWVNPVLAGRLQVGAGEVGVAGGLEGKGRLDVPKWRRMEAGQVWGECGATLEARTRVIVLPRQARP